MSLTHLQTLSCVRKTQFEAKELYLLVLSVAAVCNSIQSLDPKVVKACFLSDYRDCVYSLSPAHFRVASWEDGQIGREVFKSVLNVGSAVFLQLLCVHSLLTFASTS